MAKEIENELNQDPRERTFILTDTCLWEKNKVDQTFYPHAIEVVDDETGQVRYIQSGSRVKFLDGTISVGRDQNNYNKISKNET